MVRLYFLPGLGDNLVRMPFLPLGETHPELRRIGLFSDPLQGDGE
jgi:hypothetical protein